VRPEWLYDAAGSMLPAAEAGFVPIIGRVGANPDGLVLFAQGQEPGDLAPIPPGGTDQARALLVVGHSMRGIADDGALIYFEDQRTAVTPDMLGHVVVVEVDTDEVLVKRLLRGSRPGRYDLESIAGPTRQDAKLRWAAHITAIIPPFQARRIIRGAA
jgi:SOS-response transcriptional repressor LexA